MQSIDENRALDDQPCNRPAEALQCPLLAVRSPYQKARLLCNAGVALTLAIGGIAVTFLPSDHKWPVFGEDFFYLDGRVSKVCSWDWAGGVFGNCINWTDTFARKGMGICRHEVQNTSRCKETLLMESQNAKNAPLSVTGLNTDGSFRILYPSAQSAALQLSPGTGEFPPGCEILKRMRFLAVEHISVIAPGITDDNVPLESSDVFRLGNLAYQKPIIANSKKSISSFSNASWVYADYDWRGPVTAKCSWERSSYLNGNQIPFPWPPPQPIQQVHVDVTFRHGWNFVTSTIDWGSGNANSTGAAEMNIVTSSESTDHEWVLNYHPQAFVGPVTTPTTTNKPTRRQANEVGQVVLV
jgi:hypothetical protein